MIKRKIPPALASEALLKIPEGATLLGIPEHQMYAVIREKAIPPDAVVRIGVRRIRLRRDILEAWIAAGCPRPNNRQAAA